MPKVVLVEEEELRALIRGELERHEERTIRRGLGRGGRDLLTTSEAADLVGVRAPTIRVWIRSGKLKAHGSPPRVLRVSRVELLELVNHEGPAALTDRQPPGQRTPEQEADELLSRRRGRRSRKRLAAGPGLDTADAYHDD
jgi:excisionase family DNA binding protein